MIIRKSGEELAKMRRAGRIVAGAIETVLAEVRPGRSTLDLDRDILYVVDADGTPDDVFERTVKYLEDLR